MRHLKVVLIGCLLTLGSVRSEEKKKSSTTIQKYFGSVTWQTGLEDKCLFKQKKTVFFLGIKHLTSVLVQTLKKTFFAKFCCKFLSFWHFFSFSAQKMLKMKISTSTQTLVEIHNIWLSSTRSRITCKLSFAIMA